MPQAVSKGQGGRVRGILHVGKRVLFQIRFDLRARDAEHRADDPAALRRNAAQTAQRRPAYEIEQNRLQIVVLCVRRGNRLSEAFKKLIAKDSRCFLDAFAGLLAARQNVRT